MKYYKFQGYFHKPRDSMTSKHKKSPLRTYYLRDLRTTIKIRTSQDKCSYYNSEGGNLTSKHYQDRQARNKQENACRKGRRGNKKQEKRGKTRKEEKSKHYHLVKKT